MILKFWQKWILAALFLAVVSACQMVPTKTANQTSFPESASAVTEEVFKKFLTKNPVILDVRKPLDFSVSHPPGAISVQWDDFSRPIGKGWLVDDELSLASRLSLWGIDTDTPVLVIGYAEDGKGEEGRVAWMLKYLGVKDVAIAKWTRLRSTIPRPEGAIQNKPLWKPQVKSEFLATYEEFEKNILKGHYPLVTGARRKALQLPSGAESVLRPEYVVLDVRDLNPPNKKDLGAFSLKPISWKNFINSSGLPDAEVLSILEENGISKNKLIYVISENGVSSGLVTFVLRSWGYQAKNFAGGFEYLDYRGRTSK